MAMRLLGKKDVEVKRMLRKKNEKLMEKIYMYESYRKRYQLQAPGQNRCYEYLWVFITESWCWKQSLMFKQRGLKQKHLSVFQPRMVILPDYWLGVKPPTRISSENVLKSGKHSMFVFDLDLDSLAQFLFFPQKSQCALFIFSSAHWAAVQWFVLQVLGNPIHENPPIV